jgi:MoaA/NifB/PqqE/SkfB family radical SAM enzyme
MSLLPLTYKCNQDCVFCSAQNRDVFFELKQWINALDREKGKLIQISGGEPLLVNNIKELLAFVRLCAKRGFVIEFQTNAVLFDELRQKELRYLISEINKSGGYFNVNFSAHNKTLDYKITKTEDAFKRRVSNLKSLLKMGAKVRLTHIITRLNYKFIDKFVSFVAKELPSVSHIQFSFVKAQGKTRSKKIVPQYKNVSKYLDKALALAQKRNIEFQIDHIPLCFVWKYKNRHVDYIKKKAKLKGVYLLEKRKYPECKNCLVLNLCPGPRKDYMLLYPKFYPIRIKSHE